MKAVVLEVRDGEAAILTTDGAVRRVRGEYEVGQEFDWKAPARPSVLQWVAAVLVAALLLTGSAGLWINANYVAYAEVSLDVNPSITYTLNRRDRVLSVSAVNEDAEAIVEALQQDDIRFMPIGDAVAATLDALAREGYLDSAEDDYVLAGVSADSERAREDLSQKVEAAMGRAMQSDPTMEYRIERTDRATAREAREQGMSAGRYAAWQEAGDDRAPEDFAEMPVREIFGRGESDAPTALADDRPEADRSENTPAGSALNPAEAAPVAKETAPDMPAAERSDAEAADAREPEKPAEPVDKADAPSNGGEASDGSEKPQENASSPKAGAEAPKAQSGAAAPSEAGEASARQREDAPSEPRQERSDRDSDPGARGGETGGDRPGRP